MTNTKAELTAVAKQQTFLVQGNQALREGRYVQAIGLFNKALEQTPALDIFIRFNIDLATARLKEIDGDAVLHENDNKGLNYAVRDVDSADVNLEIVHSLKNQKAHAMFRLETVTQKFASGWALDKQQPGQPVVMRVNLDDKPYSIVETHLQRNDVQRAHGGDGFSGYRAELSPYASYDSQSAISITPLSHIFDKAEAMPIHPILRGAHYADINSVAAEIARRNITSYAINDINISISIVILNLNGEGVLKDCVSSILKFNDVCEIIVVDHASTDNSVAMLQSFKSNRIKIIQRDKNYSYSESNNLGAKKATGDILIFLNNDIILTSDSISIMASILNQGDFGLLGIKLWDLPKSDGFTLNEKERVNQHLAVHFNGLSRNETVEAFELRNSVFINLDSGILETPAVTAAMLAIKKEDFFKLNGFSTKYFYGQEDVDFCLRFHKHIRKKAGVLLDHGAYHIRGLSRASLSLSNRSYIANNRKIIQQEIGPWFRREFRQGQFERPGFWNQKPLSIAMVVSEIGFDTEKADFFTAKELGDAFEANGQVVVGYFDTKSDYDVTGYDIVIVYIDSFDSRRLKNLAPHCVLVGWARNWFDRWCDRPWIEHYDMIYASSEFGQNYMATRLKRSVGLLRIAASNECLKQVKGKKEYESDYVFTGSYFDSPREITDFLLPEKVPFKFKLFGYNWERLPHFGRFSSGPVSYIEIPSVYASTRLVVDDANVATKKWGALNCRVYDALAMGILCITNNEIGVKEIFDEDFPVYSGEDVNAKIINLLRDKKLLNSLANKYKSVVRKEHTYINRSAQFLDDVIGYVRKKKIAIKIAAPDFERGITWGDYYFAAALRNEFEQLGYAVRIDCMDQWYGDRRLNDDVNIVLRGLDRFKTRADQLNIMWLISHPDLVCKAELLDYKKVYVASELYANKLKAFTGMNEIDVLHQASSFDIEKLDPEILAQTPSHDILFIGNSRNEYRDVVRWCVEADLPIAVYGSGWEQFIPERYIKGSFISNELIPYYYNKAKIVLNDHWEDMRKNGFISNRVFDVVAVNGTILTDYVDGVENLPSQRVLHYSCAESFKAKIQSFVNNDNSKQESYISSGFSGPVSFKSRVALIDNYIASEVCG